MNRRHFFAGSLLSTGLGMSAKPASGCGGFFCSTTPIDQSGEQILFSIDDKKVTAYIQISYTGAAKDFAWVVPVMSKPQIRVGTADVFWAIQQATNVSVRATIVDGDACEDSNFGVRGGKSSGAGGTNDSANEGDPSVKVVEQKIVGPYATTILESTDAEALVKWLGDNGYTQPPQALPLIRHYVEQGMLFVALKLTQNAAAGDVVPLVLEMEASEACVPLVLTRVAAVNDMPIYIYVLADGRAMPRNWFHVEINQRKLDWLQGGSNYRALVTAAINSAAGHGFVTEHAGSSNPLAGRLYRANDFDLQPLQNATTAAAHIASLTSIPWPPAAQNTLLTLLRKHFPLPASLLSSGISDSNVYFAAYDPDYQAALATIKFDHAAVVEEVQSQLIEPLKREQTLLTGKSYLTRLFSTVSPDEMTRDPLFDFSRMLPPVSNNFVAQAKPYCGSKGDTNYIITLPTGESYLADSSGVALADGPDAEHISLVGKNGVPVFYSPGQSATVDKWLDIEAAELVIQKAPPTGASVHSATRSPSNLDSAPVPGWVPPKAEVPDSSGCSTQGQGRGADWFTLGAVGVAVWAVGRRRRREDSGAR
ncbi:MAG: DUF2330 domain-containing protein [Deltaproteobacteria bacterium]|nr:DUF2330 domain-containing protein [Deltaproteobacteria bacterium]